MGCKDKKYCRIKACSKTLDGFKSKLELAYNQTDVFVNKSYKNLSYQSLVHLILGRLLFLRNRRGIVRLKDYKHCLIFHSLIFLLL